MNRRLMAFGLAVVATQLSTIQAAWSCKCDTMDAELSSDGADMVFVGIAQEGLALTGCSCNRERETEFEVLEGFVGVDKGDFVTVSHTTLGSACGTKFKRGMSYLVFTYGGTTGNCSSREASDTLAQGVAQVSRLGQSPQCWLGQSPHCS